MCHFWLESPVRRCQMVISDGLWTPSKLRGCVITLHSQSRGVTKSGRVKMRPVWWSAGLKNLWGFNYSPFQLKIGFFLALTGPLVKLWLRLEGWTCTGVVGGTRGGCFLCSINRLTVWESVRTCLMVSQCRKTWFSQAAWIIKLLAFLFHLNGKGQMFCSSRKTYVHVSFCTLTWLNASMYWALNL